MPISVPPRWGATSSGVHAKPVCDMPEKNNDTDRNAITAGTEFVKPATMSSTAGTHSPTTTKPLRTCSTRAPRAISASARKPLTSEPAKQHR